MSDPRFPDHTFYKATGSGDLGCVEVSLQPGAIGVRDSKNQGGAVLAFDDQEWRAFLEGVKAGEFDRNP